MILFCCNLSASSSRLLVICIAGGRMQSGPFATHLHKYEDVCVYWQVVGWISTGAAVMALTGCRSQ